MFIIATFLLVTVAWGVAFCKWPDRAIGFLPLLLPCYVIRTSIGPLPTTLLELMILAMVIAWFFQKGGVRQRIRQTWNELTPWRIPVGLWLIAGLVSVFIAQNHISALGLYRAYFIEPILVFAITLSVMARHDRRSIAKKLLASLVCISAMIAGWSIVQWMTGWGIPYPWNQPGAFRAVGPFPFPNAVALFVAPIGALLFADLANRWSATKSRLIPAWLSASGFACSTIAIILAKSDGGLIALATSVFLILVMHARTRKIGLGIAVVAIILIASIAPIRERVETVLLFREWSSKVRVTIWKESVTMLKEHPVFGAGLGGYPDTITPYHTSANWMETFQYPHNILLNIWSETGLLGIIAFGWILVAWIRNAGRTNASLALPVIAVLLVHGLVDVPYFKNDLAVLFWLLILMTTIQGQKTDTQFKSPKL